MARLVFAASFLRCGSLWSRSGRIIALGAASTVGMFEIPGDGVEADHQLAQEATKHTYNRLVNALVAIDIDEVLLKDAIFEFSLRHESLLDFLAQSSNLFSFFLSSTGFPAAYLLLLLGLFNKSLFLFNVFNFGLVVVDVLGMLGLHVHHERVDHAVWVLLVGVKLFDKHLTLVQQPGQNVGVDHLLLVLVVEETSILQENIRVWLDLLQVLFRHLPAHDFLMGNSLAILLVAFS